MALIAYGIYCVKSLVQELGFFIDKPMKMFL